MQLPGGSAWIELWHSELKTDTVIECADYNTEKSLLKT